MVICISRLGLGVGIIEKHFHGTPGDCMEYTSGVGI